VRVAALKQPFIWSLNPFLSPQCWNWILHSQKVRKFPSAIHGAHLFYELLWTHKHASDVVLKYSKTDFRMLEQQMLRAVYFSPFLVNTCVHRPTWRRSSVKLTVGQRVIRHSVTRIKQLSLTRDGTHTLNSNLIQKIPIFDNNCCINRVIM